jgi:hypothetical protein
MNSCFCNLSYHFLFHTMEYVREYMCLMFHKYQVTFFKCAHIRNNGNNNNIDTNQQFRSDIFGNWDVTVFWDGSPSSPVDMYLHIWGICPWEPPITGNKMKGPVSRDTILCSPVRIMWHCRGTCHSFFLAEECAKQENSVKQVACKGAHLLPASYWFLFCLIP